MTARIFWVPHIISETGKATDFKCCTVHTFIGSVTTIEKPMKNLGKVAVGIVRESPKFLGHPYMGRIVRSSLR